MNVTLCQNRQPIPEKSSYKLTCNRKILSWRVSQTQNIKFKLRAQQIFFMKQLSRQEKIAVSFWFPIFTRSQRGQNLNACQGKFATHHTLQLVVVDMSMPSDVLFSERGQRLNDKCIRHLVGALNFWCLSNMSKTRCIDPILKVQPHGVLNSFALKLFTFSQESATITFY